MAVPALNKGVARMRFSRRFFGAVRRESLHRFRPLAIWGAPTDGAVAQMGERCNRTAEVRGSIPLGSTIDQLISAPR